MTLVRFFIIMVLLIAGTAYAQTASAQATSAQSDIAQAKAAQPAPAKTKIIDFKVLREGYEVGTHVVRVTWEGNRTIAEVEIDLEVKFAFITLYSYEHSATEVREDGKLVSLTSKTFNNGRVFWTKAVRDGSEIKTTGTRGEFTLPGTVIPTTYWSAETIKQTEFINSQTGQLWELHAKELGTEYISTPAGQVKATRYRLSGNQNMDIWYTDAGDWVNLTFDFDGSAFSYVLQSPPKT